jgi:hypothetical protein
MVTVLPEAVALYPAKVILAAMLEASVLLVLDAADAPLVMSVPFTVMVTVLVDPLPPMVSVAEGW